MVSLLAPQLQKVGLQLLLEPATSSVIFRAACNVTGVIYPALQSLKAIEDRNWLNNKQDEQWLTYWVIYGTLSLIEATVDDALGLHKFPYYFHAKFALLLWLQLPNTQGAQYLYTQWMRPTVLRFQPKIDVCFDRVGGGLSALYSIYKVPIDQLGALATYGTSQAVQFVKWFGDNNNNSDAPPGSAPLKTNGPPLASQFLTR